MQDRTSEDQNMIYGIMQTMGKGIIPRRSKEKETMKEGGDVRLIEEGRVNDL